MKMLSAPTQIPERAIFVGFHREELWHAPGYRRNLPHWRPEGATYFVTFRLADSIPETVARQWDEARTQWLRRTGLDPHPAMWTHAEWQQAFAAIPREERERFRREQQRQFFVELDKCHGSCMLETAHHVVADALQHFHGTRVWIGDFVVMPNHVHLLVQPFPGIALEEWLYSIKRFSAGAMMKDASLQPRVTMREGHVWQTESFDRVVRDEEELARTREYIAANPRRLRPGKYCLRQMEWLDEFAPRRAA